MIRHLPDFSILQKTGGKCICISLLSFVAFVHETFIAT